MIELKELKAASVIQLKNWSFALSYQLKKRLTEVQRNKYKRLYDQAKNNLGCKSLVFGLSKSRRVGYRDNDLGWYYVLGLQNSLDIVERQIRSVVRSLQINMRHLLHEEIMDREWRDVTTDLKDCKLTYSKDVMHIAKAFWDDEDQGNLGILADALEETEDCFEGQHLRRGFHSPACPVFQRIVKGVI